jgi:histone chaperone ASF1
MALVNVANMVVLDNPAPFSNPFQFEITFECLQELEDDLEWKVVYVGSAENSTYDQTLDEILVGPIPVGINKFILQADPPNPELIPSNDVLGVTVLLVTCSYRSKEFIRVGYYVNNEYTWDEEENKDKKETQDNVDDGMEVDNAAREPPMPLDMTKVVRTILANKPRVTRFPINWGDLTNDNAEEHANQLLQQQQQTISMMMDRHLQQSEAFIPQDRGDKLESMIVSE